MRRNDASSELPADANGSEPAVTPQPAADERFRTLFERASVGIARLGLDGLVIEANPALERMLGYPSAELAKMNPIASTHPSDRERSVRLLGELARGERDSYQLEKRYIRRTGEEMWCRVTIWGDGDANGSLDSALAMLEDVTARKLAEIAQNEKANQLERIIATQRDLADAADDLEEVMQVIVERARTLTGADGAMISLVEGDQLVTGAASGIGRQIKTASRPIQDTVTRFAIEARRPILIEHAESDPRLNPSLVALVGHRSHICVPLFKDSGLVAVLTVMSSSEEQRLGEEDRQTMELLASVLSAAVSRAAELDAKRRQLDALARFEAIYQAALTGVLALDAEGLVLDANPAMLELLETTAEELVGTSFLRYVHPDDFERVLLAARDLVTGGKSSARTDFRLRRRDGGVNWVETSGTMVQQAGDGQRFGIAMVQDVTQRKLAEEALVRQAQLNEHQALHDALTGLPNRRLFTDRIGHDIALARREGRRVAVAMMDLDGFKEVNDSLGHHAGDELLIQASRRLAELLRASDTVARLGGDEFGLLISCPTNRGDVLSVIDKVRQALEQPFVVDGLPLTIEASVGIAMYPDDGEDGDVLLRHADVAMYCAKDEGSAYCFYDKTRNTSDPARLTLVGELRRGIERRELTLHYQPKATLVNGTVDSVEALVRWNHPSRGMIPPDNFIPLAQQTSLIKPLTLYVIDEALSQCRAWQSEGIKLSIAVNLSFRNLLDLEFPNHVGELLDKWRVDPALLELEITESTMLTDPARTKLVLDKLASMGLSLSIDDFGTGYSSLAYLSRLPVSEIKIDRSFVINMETRENDAVIVRSTIDLARNLGLQVVAEGVETERAWETLNTLGCTQAQGYYLSRPLPADQLAAWIKEWKSGDNTASERAA
jgi:diguanylate cyclase (GGDEF)-like protein/PAS domain S-box-containing protein